MKLVTAEGMRNLEAAAMATGRTAQQLMEEAGLALAQEAWMLLGTLEGRRIVVLAGPGNNGGDGLVAACHLAEWGADVTAYLPAWLHDTGRLARLRELDVAVVDGRNDPEGTGLAGLLDGASLVLDALLGIGQSRPLDPDGPFARTLDCLREARGRPGPPQLVAVDLPTGLDADTGAVDPHLVVPDLTVTFGLPKVGMYQWPGSAAIGNVQVIDIGIPAGAVEALDLSLLTANAVRALVPSRPEDANKGTFGRMLVVGGCGRFSGAVQLAAVSGYRAGAGLVTVAAPEGVVDRVAHSLVEATWLAQPAGPDGGLTGEVALALRGGWEAFKSVVFGPGMGDSPGTRAFTWAALPDLAAVAGGVVIDADGLNALAALPDGPGRVPANAILTPHPGEMARLLATTIDDVQRDRIASARAAATKFGCVVVLKGAHTVVAAPTGRTAISPFANPLLATAGSGDVLAGMAGAYLAQGLAPFDAACVAVYLHGAAGESLRAEYGDSGLLARELPDRLPRVARDVRAR